MTEQKHKCKYKNWMSLLHNKHAEQEFNFIISQSYKLYSDIALSCDNLVNGTKWQYLIPKTHKQFWRYLPPLFRSMWKLLLGDSTLKLMSAIFYQIFVFHQSIAFQKLWKMFFISSKKLFLFLRYSNFLFSSSHLFLPISSLSFSPFRSWSR